MIVLISIVTGIYMLSLDILGASLVAQRLKRPPAMQETWVRSMGQEDPLEKEMATDCSILAWEIPWTEEPGGLQSKGHKESDSLSTHTRDDNFRTSWGCQ